MMTLEQWMGCWDSPHLESDPKKSLQEVHEEVPLVSQPISNDRSAIDVAMKSLLWLSLQSAQT